MLKLNTNTGTIISPPPTPNNPANTPAAAPSNKYSINSTLSILVSCCCGLNQCRCADDQNNKDDLQSILQEAKQLREKVKQLQASHRAVWLQEYKVFGWEVMDVRYGGVLSRNETLILLLTDYLDGKINQIMELEETKLPFSAPEYLGEGTLGRGFYSELITTGKISGC